MSKTPRMEGKDKQLSDTLVKKKKGEAEKPPPVIIKLKPLVFKGKVDGGR